MTLKSMPLRRARISMSKVAMGQVIGREVIVWAHSDPEARSAARVISGPLYEVVKVTWLPDSDKIVL